MNNNLTSVFIAGSAAGIASSFIVSPVEHMRIRMQIQGSGAKKTYNGSADALTKIFKSHGVKGVMKGWAPTLMRDGWFYGAYFAVYELVVRALKTGDPET